MTAQMDADPLVTCEGLVKIYKVADLEVTALQRLDLEVRRGEMLAVMGASGSGKTTLLNILGALDLPSAGRCVVAGYDLARLSEAQRNSYRGRVIGQLWQQSGRNLFAGATLAHNVGMPQALAGRGRGARDARSAELLKVVGLAGMEGRRPGQLSGGEQQRCAIAVALANDPPLLLADEPTGELDSKTAWAVLEVLRDCNRSLGLTVITVTHDPAIAARCDRTIAIRDGRTSTETVRLDTPGPAAGADDTRSPLTGLPTRTHREAVVVDRAGRVQLPRDAVERLGFHGRAEVREREDHLELWPLQAPTSSAVEDEPTGEGLESGAGGGDSGQG